MDPVPVILDPINYCVQRAGGVRTYFNEVLGRLYRRGDIDLQVLKRDGVMGSLPGNVQIADSGLGLRCSSRLGHWLTELCMNLRLLEVSHGVFHSTYFTTFFCLRIPQVLTIHDMIDERFARPGDGRELWRKRRSACVRRAAAFIAVSKNTRNEFCEYFRIPESRVWVISHGVSEKFGPRGEKQIRRFCQKYHLYKPFLLYVGSRDNRYKNFWETMEYLSTWSSGNEYEVVAVGGGPLTVAEEGLLERCSCRENLRLVGQLSDEDLILAYNGCQALVYPSRTEGFGLPLLEALACGTPVVSSNAGALREVAGQHCGYFDPDSPDEFVFALSTALDQGRANQFVQARISHAKSFSWNRAADETLAVYRSVAN